MATDLPFSLAALSGPARRHIRVFQLHQFLDRFAMGLTVAIVALALLDRGMDLFQISLLFGVYSVTTLTTELPFGGLADTLGRKPVFLAAVVASLISLALFLSTSDVYVLALSFAFIGLGRALRSGTLDAWFVETFQVRAPGVDVQPALARAQGAGALGLGLGAIIGGLLPDVVGGEGLRLGFSVYDVSYVLSFAVMLGVFAYTLLVIEERPPARAPAAHTPASLQRAVGALKEGVRTAPRVIKDASRLAFTDPALSLLLAALAVFLMATNPVEVLWPTHVRPMLEGDAPGTRIGALTASYFFAIALGAWLSPHLSRLLKRQHAVTLAVAFAGLAASQVALSLQGGLSGFAAVFLLYSVLLGVTETPASSILHRAVPDHQRSTLLSLRSLIQQLGAVLGLLMAGAVAESSATPTAWQIGAALLVLSVLLVARLAKRLASEV